MTVKNVFVSGGTGFVGSHIINALLKKGHHVKALSTNGSRGYMPEGAEIVKGNILLPETWADGVSQCDVFINLVGIIRENPKKGITFENLHVQAAKNVINICKTANISRLLHMSANGASPSGATPYLVTKYKAEELIMASGLNYTIFRPSVIFGAEDQFINNFAKIIISLSVFPIFGKGDYKLQPVYVEDVANAFVKSICTPDCYDKAFCVGGPDEFAYIDLIKCIADVLGQKVYMPAVPMGAARAIAGVMGRFSFFPATRDQIDMLAAGNVCHNTELFSILGIHRKSLLEYLNENFALMAKK